MNKKEIIETLELENELMTFNPLTGEYLDPLFLTKENKKCYEANKEAIKVLKMLQDIADGKIKKCGERELTIYNNEWLFQHRFEMSTLVPSIPVEWIEKHYLKADPSLYTVEDCVIENMLVDWRKENEQTEID